MAEDAAVEETWGQIAVNNVESNSLGLWDGQRFYLRSFPVWYRWRVVPTARHNEKPESGEVKGVNFEQSMGRMILWYNLAEFGEVSEEDVCVEMSSWQLEVQVGSNLTQAKGRITGGRKIEALTGELWSDIRLHLSWWELQQDEVGHGKWLVIHLTKMEHRAWTGPWFTDCFNPHKKMSFPWMDQQTIGRSKEEDEKLVRKAAGPPQALEKDLVSGMMPERLCTGLDEEEDEYHAFIIIHLDEEAMERASGTCPMEEIFSADLNMDRVEVYLRNEGFGVCSGTLKGIIEPQLTAWEFTNVRRMNLPKNSHIKCPAFFNPALRIKLVKAAGYQNIWGGVFAERVTAQFEMPRERMLWTERVQRALVLSPAAPLKNNVKVEKARKMCTRIECSQDTVTQRANIIFHLDEALEELAFKFKVDLTTFFSLKVGERLLDVGIIADAEFQMALGRLGGAVDPDKTTWEIVREKNALGSEKDHLALKISLAKAAGHRDRWQEVFEKLEPWQVNEMMRPALGDEVSKEALAEAADGNAE
mmetsp:Transcript_69219/g.175943  ORF Transcript_69219/g.175943 Transcript_69219/m.175943 type:complete len:531 (+) Transcript_69219:54-1646(+)